MARFQKRAQLITWDLKGHGASGAAKNLSSLTMVDLADDLRRVLDAAKIERAVLFGFSLGCQIILEAWRLMPERIEALVPMFGSYGKPFRALFLPGIGWVAFQMFRRFGPLTAGPGLTLVSKIAAVPGRAALLRRSRFFGRTVPNRDIEAFCRHLALVHGPTWHRIAMESSHHDVHAGNLLDTIHVPVLLVAAERDNFTPPELSRDIYTRIARNAQSQFTLLPTVSHDALLEVPERICEVVETFLEASHLIGTHTEKSDVQNPV